MTLSSPADLHIYQRHIDQQERTSLSVLAERIPEGATVLDLGCGSGALGQHLVQHRRCTVDGLTLSEAEAALARPHYRRVEVANLEDAPLAQLFAAGSYDAIVCADVLEHLRQPEQVLTACRSLLAPGGQLLVSVPNAGYCGLIAELLHGEFRYRDEGLLDRTHLRFFTRRSLQRFLAEQRWALAPLETIRRELPDSEFGTEFDRLPPAVARYLLAVPDALSYQFIGSATPLPLDAPVPGTDDPAPVDALAAQALFTAQLYWSADGSLTEDRKLTQAGQIGNERQTLRFALPQAPEATTPRLRLDPADRPGFLHLYSLRLCDDQGSKLWEWRAHTEAVTTLEAMPHQQLVLRPPLPTAPDRLLVLLAGEDPWLELPIPAATLASALQAGGTTLEVELGWPMSADYLVMAQSLMPVNDKITALQDALQQSQLQTQHTAAALAQAQATLQQAQAQAQAQTARQITLTEQAHAKTQAQNQQLLLQQQQLQGQLQTALRERQNLIDHLQRIENSTVFRVTRPLVHTKMWIDRQLSRGEAPPVHPTADAFAGHAITPPAQPVDIIVPVYRGLDDTWLCVESVLASTCRTDWQLVVINDASPEPEVTAWLRDKAAQEPRITLLENGENLGFVGTVNRGMALNPTHDVLLLNSDTEVANDWLDRLRRAAYSDRRVASVTPFSNNATICSYPRFCEANALPPGMSTASLDALCARTNAGAAIDIPTGVGFCMYIRRDSLDAVGLFDTAHFGKGYGEENDFCQRAFDAGWRNLHALDTFVLHTGGVSFGESKSPREMAAMETLRRLHPRYEVAVHQFVQADPARPWRIALDLARLLQEGDQPVVLAVLHDRAGGTVRHVHELAQHLQGQARFLQLTPAGGGAVHLGLPGAPDKHLLRFELPAQENALLALLRQLGVQHIHYHHLLGHGEAVRQLPARLGVPYDFTAHDYYSYCPQISLTDHTQAYCGEKGLDQCRQCLQRAPAPGGVTIEAWRSNHLPFVEGARHVLVPSRDAARRMARFAPKADIRLAPHTDLLDTSLLPTPSPRARTPSASLKIAVIGALSVIKGADLLEATAQEAARRGAPIEFHLLGYGYRHLQGQPKARLTVHGAYAEKDLPSLLDWLQPDLVWFPAQWPETYSYTLSACLQAGLPVVAPDLGAFAERLAGRPWSWVRPWNTPAAAWVDWFTALREQHFAVAEPGATPPALPTQPMGQAEDALIGPWSYASDYLRGMHPLPAGPSPKASELQAWLPTSAPAASRRARAVSALVRLRNSPGLRTLARAIPAHWQRRVKNWILGHPG